MRLINPVDFLSGPATPERLPPGRAAGPAGSPRAASVIRATHGTVRAQRLVRKIAVQIFGRGKTRLEYRYAHWFVHVHDTDGRFVASFVAVDRQPGAFNSGIELIPAP